MEQFVLLNLCCHSWLEPGVAGEMRPSRWAASRLNYVPATQTRLLYCDAQRFAGHGKNGNASHRTLREESVMKCSNPHCDRGIGLVAHRRGWGPTSTRLDFFAANEANEWSSR